MGYNFGCMIASDTMFDSIGVGFRSQAIRWRHSRFRGSKGRWNSNRFRLSIYGVHIDATWRIWLNRPCAAAMRPYVKLLWPLVILKEKHLTAIQATVTVEKFGLQTRSQRATRVSEPRCWTKNRHAHTGKRNASQSVNERRRSRWCDVSILLSRRDDDPTFYPSYSLIN